MTQRILVLEDHPLLRENLRELLDSEGYAVQVAGDGEAGLALARIEPPDLVVCDVGMPVMDGLGFVEAARADVLLATVPILMLSAITERETVRRAMVLGADDYVAKPFTPEEVLDAVSAQLAKRARREEEAGRATEALRSTILSSLPHELRTPLSGIIGFASLLVARADSLDAARVRAHADAILRSGRRLEDLVQRYLLFSELRAEAAGLDGRWVDDVVHAALADVQQPAPPDREIVWDIECARVHASPEALQRIVQELVGNACKFADAGTRVSVRARRVPGHWELQVENTGPALPPGADRRFGALVQFGRDQREQQGAGLGLAICGLLLARHGGMLRVDDPSGRPMRVVARLRSAD